MKKFFLLTFATILLTTCSCQFIFESSPDPTLEIPQLDNAARDLMLKYNIPALSLAITRDENLVYAKTYGLNSFVSYINRFRIASVSKPITAVAIMKLQEEGLLSLDDRVFGSEGILGTDYGTLPYSEGITDITVRHLLLHTSGGWENGPNDPMFIDPTIPIEELISWTLDNQPLTSEPGETYAYSNFGYALLGRIIEKVTGETYENYVQSEILEPIGINNMEIAGNTRRARKRNEVVYYGQGGDNPYIYNIERMDAHGGWIATAIDLARLIVRVDGFNEKSDILSDKSIEIMKSGSEANPGYALGWFVNQRFDNWFHTGVLPGTYAFMVRSSGGFNWVILMNSRSLDPQFGDDVDSLVWNAINDPDTQWPDVDLF